MLFNSYEFIFAFLPVTIAGFYLLGPVSRRWALHWLILASFFFYAWWRPLNVLLIAPSILINFVLARTLQRLVRNEKRRRASLAGLVLGLAFNVAFLGYFKYTYFLGTAINDVFGSNLILTRIILPLGISFITFQKIAFLIDVHSRRIESFTLQDYFDFSGYTDMALGAARLFGIRLPPNFNSPLRASSIIDFWLRWHMTLTRFLTAYIYNPLVLYLTRRRLAKGRAGFGGRDTTVGAFALLLMFPTLLTMFISGLWHGAGYLFVLWGLLHGVYLTINHAWRLVAPKLWPDRAGYARIMKPIGLVLTLVAVFASMVFFRSATVSAAVDLVKGMIGLNGVSLPLAVYERLGPLAGWLRSMGVVQQPWGGQDFMTMTIAIPILMLVVLACPNTLQILARYEPAIGVKPRPADTVVGRMVEWNPSVAWATGISVIAAIGILSLGGPREFLYWQF